MIQHSTLIKLVSNDRDNLRSALADVFRMMSEHEQAYVMIKARAAGFETWGKMRDAMSTSALRYILAPFFEQPVVMRFEDVLMGTYVSRPNNDWYKKFTVYNKGGKEMAISNAELGNILISAMHGIAAQGGLATQEELINKVLAQADAYGSANSVDMTAAKAVFTLWSGIHLNRHEKVEGVAGYGLAMPTLNEEQAKIAGEIVGGPGAKPIQSATPEKLEAPALDVGMSAAINAILAQATGGKMTDINVVFSKLTDVTNALVAKDKELADTRLKLAMRPVAANITVKASGTEPNGKSGEVNLADVFTASGAKREATLEFKVPNMEWDAAHPDVPEIDEDYQFRPDLLATLGMALLNNDRVWITGDTGTGKTTGVEQFAARLGMPFHRLNLDSDVMRDDLLGGIELHGAATKYVEGILPRVMTKPGFLCLDEIDRMKPDLGYVVAQFLESNGGLRLLADGGRMVHPHPLFRIVATANTVGMGDESGHYQGARHQSLAILNRFNKWATVDYLPKEDEMKLLMAKAPGLTKDIAERLVNFAKEVRAGFRTGSFMYVVSPRNLMTLARDYMFMSSLTDANKAMEQVTRNTILNSLTMQDNVAVREIASRTLGVSRK